MSLVVCPSVPIPPPTVRGKSCPEISERTGLPKVTLYSLPLETMEHIATYACCDDECPARLIGPDAKLNAKRVGLSSVGFVRGSQASLFYHMSITTNRGVDLWSDILAMGSNLPLHVWSVELDSLGVTEMMDGLCLMPLLRTGGNLLVLSLRCIFLSPVMNSYLAMIAPLFSNIRVDGCVYGDLDCLAVFSSPAIRRLSFAIDVRSVCHPIVVPSPPVQQTSSVALQSYQLTSLSYWMERGPSYLMQSPAIQSHFASCVHALTNLYFRGDSDVFPFIQGIIRSSGGTLESLDLMLFHWPVMQPRATFDLSDCVSLEYVYLGDDARFVYALSKSIQSLHQPSGALCRITILIQLLRNIFRAEQWKELRDVLQNTENFPVLSLLTIDINVATIRRVCDPDVTRTIADLKHLFGEESVKLETDVQHHIGVDVG